MLIFTGVSVLDSSAFSPAADSGVQTGPPAALGLMSDSGISEIAHGTATTNPITPPIASVALAKNWRRDCSSGVPGSEYACAWAVMLALPLSVATSAVPAGID